MPTTPVSRWRARFRRSAPRPGARRREDCAAPAQGRRSPRRRVAAAAQWPAETCRRGRRAADKRRRPRSGGISLHFQRAPPARLVPILPPRCRAEYNGADRSPEFLIARFRRGADCVKGFEVALLSLVAPETLGALGERLTVLRPELGASSAERQAPHNSKWGASVTSWTEFPPHLRNQRRAVNSAGNEKLPHALDRIARPVVPRSLSPRAILAPVT